MKYYYDEPAWKHTREQVNELRASGMTVLSYFITDSKKKSDDDWFYDAKARFNSQDARCREAFRIMYGRDARFVNVDAVPEIARTLNEMFLDKNG